MPLYKSHINQGQGGQPPRAKSLAFAELLTQERPEDKSHFIRYLSNGRLPSREPVAKEPEITQEELERRRLEQLERETWQRAYAAGERAGLEMGGQRINLVLRRLDHLLRELDGLPLRIMMATEQFMVETAIVLVQELLKHELAMQPEGIAHRVRAILEEAAGRDAMVLHLHPDDAHLVSRMPGFEHLTVQPDPSVAPGSVRLESAFGGIEENIPKQLEEIEQSLRSRLHARLDDLSGIPLPQRPAPELMPEPPPGSAPPPEPIDPALMEGILDPDSVTEDPGEAAWREPLEPPPPRVHPPTPHLDTDPLEEEEEGSPRSLSAMAAPESRPPVVPRAGLLSPELRENLELPPPTEPPLPGEGLVLRQLDEGEVRPFDLFQRDFGGGAGGSARPSPGNPRKR